MQDKYLTKLSKRFNRKIIISLDSSVYEVYGNCKETSSQSDKNIFGFHPLLLHIHQTGELLDIIFRPGAEFTSTGAVDMLEANILRLKPYLFIKVGAQIIKSGRYVIIRFGKNFDRVAEFSQWFELLQQPLYA